MWLHRHLALAILAGVWEPCRASPHTEIKLVTVSVTVSSPMVIAVLPPRMRLETNEGDGEASAHLRHAVEDTEKFVRSKNLRMESIYADRIIVHDGNKPTAFLFNGRGQE